MKLSDQALGAIMMALQKAILQQRDVTDILRRFNLFVSEDQQLVVENPPTFEVSNNQDDLAQSKVTGCSD